ncbi:MAG: hypothetical protein Q4G42_07460 [Neisseria sp.]|nr:hypothetical protein [Neisseria sp.]
MNTRNLLGMVLVGMLLAACNKPSSSVSAENIESAASQAQQTKLQTLTDDTQRIAVTVPDGFIALPANESGGDNITLLAQNAADDVTLYVTRAGALKTTPAQYFTRLGEVVKQQAAYREIKVGAATENRMNYQFAYGEDGENTHESCMAVIDENNLYSVCAYSNTQPFETLAKYLKDVRIVK